MNDIEIPGQTPSPSPVPCWELPPDPPPMSFNWVDISDDLDKACQELQLGELVHEPNFGLFEAMSAIEMMDPKMDAGMVGKLTKRKVLSFKQAIDSGALKILDLNFDELIGIMDTSLCCLLSWLEGQTLAQTVFTCLYLHDPNLTEDRCLRAYSLCMLKLCDIIREKVNKANVFEEEDFQTITYGFKFAENVTDLRVVGMMKEVEDEYGRKLRQLKSQKGDSGGGNSEINSCNGVIARIKFLKTFLQCLMVFGKREAESSQPVKKQLNTMLDHLNTIARTIDFGIKPILSDDGHMIMHGFEPLVNQKLLPPTFPRYATLRKREDIPGQYSQLIKRLILVTEVTTLSGFQNILEFVDKFGRSVPCVLSRSILQLTFLPENHKVFGHQVLTEYIKDGVRTFNSPPIFSPKCPTLQNDVLAKKHSEIFLTQASRMATCLIRAYGHNRARHREKLAAFLEDFSTIQDETDRIDAELNAIYQNGNSELSHLTCLGSWTLYHSLKVMTQYILSGFELELYSPHELHYIYWYLAEILLSWLITTISRAEQQLAKDEALGDQQGPARGRNSKKNKKNKKKTKVHVKELKMTQGMQMMAAGCFKGVLGFFLSKKLVNPDFSLDSECRRYEHRFLPFVNIATPPFMLFSQFHEMTDVNQYQPPPTAEQLYASAAKHFSQAKSLYETLPNPTDEVQELCKVAKTNIVVMKLLATGHTKDSTAKPEFDFTVHKYFPIFKVS